MDNPKKRMALLYSLKTRLLNNFYKKQEETRQLELTRIADHNTKLLKARTPTFIFEGTWYANFFPFDPNPAQMKDCNRVLHDSLREQVVQLVHPGDFESLEDHAQIANLVGNVLDESNTEWDIKQLLPTEFLNGTFMTLAEYDVFNVGSPLTAEELLSVKEKNAEGYACLGRVRLTKLLLPDS